MGTHLVVPGPTAPNTALEEFPASTHPPPHTVGAPGLVWARVLRSALGLGASPFPWNVCPL